MGELLRTKVQKILDAVVATVASIPLVLPAGKKMFHISMASGTATVVIEGSVDGVNWTVLYTVATSTSTAEKDVELDDVYPQHRARVSAWTSGAITVTAAWPARA